MGGAVAIGGPTWARGKSEVSARAIDARFTLYETVGLRPIVTTERRGLALSRNDKRLDCPGAAVRAFVGRGFDTG